MRYKTILSSAESGGFMSIVDSLSPAGSGAPRRIRDREDEAFILLSGACEFWLEDQIFIREVGETFRIPRGREHTFRVAGNEPCRHLVTLTPGGFEGFFGDMAKGSFRIPEDMERINAVAARHDLRSTGSPPGAE